MNILTNCNFFKKDDRSASRFAGSFARPKRVSLTGVKALALFPTLSGKTLFKATPQITCLVLISVTKLVSNHNIREKGKIIFIFSEINFKISAQLTWLKANRAKTNNKIEPIKKTKARSLGLTPTPNLIR